MTAVRLTQVAGAIQAQVTSAASGSLWDQVAFATEVAAALAA
jgi:hypothetical protein